MESRSTNSQEKNEANYPATLTQANLVKKGFIVWISEKVFLWDSAGSPERGRQLHLACPGSQSQRTI